ncbi:MAG TPA: amidohydrolase family protein [Pyrinomonadaceae bacterium]|nr:amidohydrolase family protein [Pyrinomonadaceae bacterium]
MKAIFLLTIGLVFIGVPAFGQTPAPTPEPTMTVDEYEPRSTLVVPQHPVTRAKYPFIDVHTHFNTLMSRDKLAELVHELDQINLSVAVDLSGKTGADLAAGVKNMKGAYPKRFVLFANLSYQDVDDPDYGRKAAARLEQDVKNGAQGLKIFKEHGLTIKDGAGQRIPTNDPRFDPIWAKCAELHIPVLIHTGEPRQFFEPQDRYNERWLELKQFPNRARPPSRYPSWEKIMGEQYALFAKHPRTTFIAAHLSWHGGDLASLGQILDTHPNMNVDIAAVLAELGRQPRFAREWFIRYQDRVLFGKDITDSFSEYHVYFRVLETSDEYFDYYRRRHAFWKMYGLALPDDVLKKLYYKNALRIIPGIDPTVFPQ